MRNDPKRFSEKLSEGCGARADPCADAGWGPGADPAADIGAHTTAQSRGEPAQQLLILDCEHKLALKMLMITSCDFFMLCFSEILGSGGKGPDEA